MTCGTETLKVKDWKGHLFFVKELKRPWIMSGRKRMVKEDFEKLRLRLCVRGE